MPEGGLNTRLSLDTLGIQARKQEALMQDYKIYAALAYARANKLNHVTIDSPHARLGLSHPVNLIWMCWKRWKNWALMKSAAEIGIRLYKVAMPWPLEPDGIREFAQGWMKFWWSKKNARWWNTSSKNSCITGATMCVRA
jgi:indolepyruvate ferredoxin oxidoreductase